MKWSLPEVAKWSRALQSFIKRLFGGFAEGAGQDADSDILRLLSAVDDEDVKVVFT